MEEIITTLNLTKFSKKPSKVRERIAEEIVEESSSEPDSLEMFQKIYEDKIQRESKRNKAPSILLPSQ